MHAKTLGPRRPPKSGSTLDMLSHFIDLFIYFYSPSTILQASSCMAAAVTDGLKGLRINGRGILSLFSDIFPIATRLGLRLLTVHETEGRMMGGREGGK